MTFACPPHLGSPTPVDLAPNLHWAAAAGCELVEYDIDPSLPVRDQLAHGAPFSLERITDGRIAVPEGPGLGIDIDESAFRKVSLQRQRDLRRDVSRS